MRCEPRRGGTILGWDGDWDIEERLEALTQSLELLSTLPRDNEKGMDQRMGQIPEAMARNQKQMAP